MIVLDASALAEVLLRGPRTASVEAVMFARHETLHAPHLLDIEVTHAIRRHAASGSIRPQRALECLQDLVDLKFTRYPHTDLVLAIWALRHNFSVYDAAYVALADILGAKLLTLDLRLAAAVRAHTNVDLA